MRSTDKRQVAILAEHCHQAGVNNIVISPGSRNAPLIIAFQSHPDINCFIIHDERCAAFFALGIAESRGEPVALTCTSGSALLNYAPAIAEAYYRQIPLLVLSADRPSELIDQGDGQTMRQGHVYSNYIKSSFSLENHTQADAFKGSVNTIYEGLSSLMSVPYGPVHINVPLAEPLYGEVEIEEFDSLRMAEKTTSFLSQEDVSRVQNTWLKTEKKLIIIGQMKPNKRLSDLVIKLSEDPSVAILVENTSNIQHFPKIVHSIDRALANISESELDSFQPDLILSIGGAVVSKRIKSFLRSSSPENNWRVGEFTIQEDTYQNLTKAYHIEPVSFIDILLKTEPSGISNYGGRWKQKDFLAQDVHDKFLANLAFSDLKAIEIILDSLPDSTNLHMSNSSVVRYCQLFSPIASFNYYANRGLSGIDGSTSTVAGFSSLNKDRSNVLITGDTSFFYDSNALWNQYLSDNLKIIVIRNGGGGIFQIIDGPNESSQSDTFFAPFEASVQGVCEAYNAHYLFANSIETLEDVFFEFMSRTPNNRPTVLEIDTKKCQNAACLKDYFKAIANSRI